MLLAGPKLVQEAEPSFWCGCFGIEVERHHIDNEEGRRVRSELKRFEVQDAVAKGEV